MVKPRLIPVILIQNGWVVQSIGFKRYLPIGRLKFAIEFFSRWDVDEIVVLNIDSNQSDASQNKAFLHSIATHCFLPLTIGGGIQTHEDIRAMLWAGADKVSINAAALQTPKFITSSAALFGSQCIVVSIDVHQTEKGRYEVMSRRNKSTGKDPVQWAKEVEALGAGEILLQAIHKDGMKTGYDLELIQKVIEGVSIPVIVAGGAGNAAHLLAGVQAGASGISAGNMFQFCEHSTLYAKGFLKQHDAAIRLTTSTTYQNAEFDATGRLLKQPDETLEQYFHSYQIKDPA